MSFSFKNLGHYVAVVARDVVKVAGVVNAVAPTVEAVTGLVSPSAVVIERAAFSALGSLAHAASGVTAVADGNQNLTVTLAASEVADFKELAAYFQGLAKKQGVKL